MTSLSVNKWYVTWSRDVAIDTIMILPILYSHVGGVGEVFTMYTYSVTFHGHFTFISWYITEQRKVKAFIRFF